MLQFLFFSFILTLRIEKTNHNTSNWFSLAKPKTLQIQKKQYNDNAYHFIYIVMKISKNHKSIITNTVLTACFLTAIFCSAVIQTQTITDIIKKDETQEKNINFEKTNNSQKKFSPNSSSPKNTDDENKISTPNSTSWLYPLIQNSISFQTKEISKIPDAPQSELKSIALKLKNFQDNSKQSASQSATEKLPRLNAPIVGLGIRG